MDEPDIEYLIKEIAKTADPFWIAEGISAEQAAAPAHSAAGSRRTQTAQPPRRKVSAKGATVAGGQLTSALPRPRP